MFFKKNNEIDTKLLNLIETLENKLKRVEDELQKEKNKNKDMKYCYEETFLNLELKLFELKGENINYKNKIKELQKELEKKEKISSSIFGW